MNLSSEEMDCHQSNIAKNSAVKLMDPATQKIAKQLPMRFYNLPTGQRATFQPFTQAHAAVAFVTCKCRDTVPGHFSSATRESGSRHDRTGND